MKARLIVAAFVLAAVLVACGSAPTGEETDSTAQAQTAPPKNGTPAPRSPVPPPAAVCVSHPGCAMVPFSSPATFPVPQVLTEPYDAHAADHCTDDSNFTAYLASIGCIPVGNYKSAGEDPLHPWAVPIGFCPMTPVTTEPVAWETIPCDECTGTPENGYWVVVAYANPDVHACTGGSPGAGCALGGCLPPGGKNGTL